MSQLAQNGDAFGVAPGGFSPDAINHDPMFDTAQAAIFLHSSDASLERFRRIGTGPKFVKMGGAIRYRRSDLDAYILECTQSPRRHSRRHRVA